MTDCRKLDDVAVEYSTQPKVLLLKRLIVKMQHVTAQYKKQSYVNNSFVTAA